MKGVVNTMNGEKAEIETIKLVLEIFLGLFVLGVGLFAAEFTRTVNKKRKAKVDCDRK